MPEKKNREKVIAEITVTHLMQFSGEIGRAMSREEAINFLNHDGRAYKMWKHMMHAAEEYLKSTLNQSNVVSVPRPVAQRSRMVV